jgi:hypothetical protein
MKEEINTSEATAWLAWFGTPEGRQWAAGFDYFLFMLNDSQHDSERQHARESLQRMIKRGPQGGFTDVMNDLYVYMAEQRML